MAGWLLGPPHQVIHLRRGEVLDFDRQQLQNHISKMLQCCVSIPKLKYLKCIHFRLTLGFSSQAYRLFASWSAPKHGRVACWISPHLVLFSHIAISNRYIAMGHPQYFIGFLYHDTCASATLDHTWMWIYHDLSLCSSQRKHVPDATGPRWDRDSASIDPRYPGHGQSWQKKTSRVHLYVWKARYCSGGLSTPMIYVSFISEEKLGSLNNKLGIGSQWATPFYSRPRCRFLGERDCVSWRNSVSNSTWKIMENMFITSISQSAAFST